MAALVATTSFAQDITKQLKGKSFDEASAVLNSSLSGLSAEQKAKGYGMLTDIAYKDASTAFDTYQLNAATGKKDPVNFLSVYNAIESACQADIFDNQPNDKGKVAPKLHKKNLDRLQNLRVLLIVAGQECQDKEDNDGAMKYFQSYVNSANSSLFAEVAGKKDQNAGNVSRVLAYLYARRLRHSTEICRDSNG